MASSQGPQSSAEVLKEIAALATQGAMLPDADSAFLMKLAMTCVQKARQPQMSARPGAAAAPGGVPPAPPGAGLPGPGAGGSPANAAMPTLGAPTAPGGPMPPGSGVTQGLNPAGENADELRRMLAANVG